MQSGGAKGNRWRLDWDILPGGGRWENPLMGWASSYASRSKTQAVVVIDCDAGRTMSKEPGFRSDPRKMPFTLPRSKVGPPPTFLSLKPTQDDECVCPRLGLLCVSPPEELLLAWHIELTLGSTKGKHHPLKESRPRIIRKILSINRTSFALSVQSRMYPSIQQFSVTESFSCEVNFFLYI